MDTRFSFEEPRLGSLSLAGELSIYVATEVRDLLVDRLAASDALEVDLSGVSELDCAGVQLLLMLRQEAARAHKPLQWRGHSHAVRQVLARLNLGSALGAPAELVD